MKSILYAGAALMIGASIYGFIDYNKNSHKEEFTAMYDEKKSETPVVKPEEKKETVVITKKDEKKTVSKKQSKKAEKVLTVDPIDPLTAETRLGKTETKTIENISVGTKLGEDKPAVKKTKKKKRLNREIFSRAPIREVDLEEQPVKKSVKKDL